MKVKITPSVDLKIEIDGNAINGTFRIESEWEGFIKLRCDGPCATVIVRKPALAMNPYDYVPTIFGGGQNPEKLKSIETEVVLQDAFINPIKEFRKSS